MLSRTVKVIGISKKQILLVFIISSLCTFLYVPFRENKTIELCVELHQPTLLETFWRDSVTFYPQDTKVFTVDSIKPHVLVADFSFNKPVAQIRIDPVQKVGESAEISWVKLYSNGALVKVFSASDVQLAFRHDLMIELINGRCVCTATGSDPHIALDIPLSASTLPSLFEKILIFGIVYFKFLLLTLLVCSLCWFLLHKPHWFIFVSFLAVFVLMLAMVFISPLDGHPDEYFHKITSEFYFTHWMPTHPDDPIIFFSYRLDYNISRINSPGLAYLFSGRFGYLIHFLIDNVTICIRLFSVFLLLSLLLFYRGLKQYYVLFIPIVLSPQIWYLFSYVNDEALPVFLSFLIVYILFNAKTWFHRFLDSQSLFGGLGYALLLIIPLFLLMISKFNFGVFVLFIPLLIIYIEVSKFENVSIVKAVRSFLQFSNLRFKKYCFVAIAALFMSASYYGVYFYIHSDSNRPALTINQELEIKNRVAISKQLFKPSYKLQGISYFDMMKEWSLSTFQSSAGKYNYMLVSGSALYYIVMAALYFSLFVLLIFLILKNAVLLDTLLLWVSVLYILGMVFISSYLYSWQYDYQPQGRYLFPILPIFGVLFYLGLKRQVYRSVALLVVVLFLLSMYSFLMVGVRSYL